MIPFSGTVSNVFAASAALTFGIRAAEAICEQQKENLLGGRRIGRSCVVFSDCAQERERIDTMRRLHSVARHHGMTILSVVQSCQELSRAWQGCLFLARVDDRYKRLSYNRWDILQELFPTFNDCRDMWDLCTNTYVFGFMVITRNRHDGRPMLYWYQAPARLPKLLRLPRITGKVKRVERAYLTLFQ